MTLPGHLTNERLRRRAIARSGDDALFLKGGTVECLVNESTEDQMEKVAINIESNSNQSDTQDLNDVCPLPLNQLALVAGGDIGSGVITIPK
jgi:hypothetical protein